MSKFQLLALIALLASASLLGTVGLIQANDSFQELPPAPQKASRDKTETAGNFPLAKSSAEVTALAEGLSANNLFVPERGPRVEDPEGGETVVDAGLTDLELTGIGKIGDRQAAIITVNARRTSSRTRRPPTPAGELPQKKIFNIGDTIADTGLTLAKINFDKREGICEVELTEPGGGTRILKMETDDKASQSRSSKASQTEVKTASINIPRPALTPDSVKPPPPPVLPGTEVQQGGASDTPPTPNILSTGSNGKTSKVPLGKMSREDRLKKILELRQERLKESTSKSPNGKK